MTCLYMKKGVYREGRAPARPNGSERAVPAFFERIVLAPPRRVALKRTSAHMHGHGISLRKRSSGRGGFVIKELLVERSEAKSHVCV